MRLTDEQIELYSRQIILREVGGTGQSALRAARVRVAGTGAAAEACTSYLVGAGIGSVVVDADAATSTTSRALGLPDAGRRTPDASVVDGRHADEGAHSDVHLDLAPDAGGAIRDAELPAAAVVPAPARLGAIVLRADARGGLRLVVLPADTGCPACVRIAAAPRGPADPAPGPIALASAGALAALIACRWLLAIGDDRAARALALAGAGGVWTDDAPPVRTACPRGCPPPAPPV